MFRSLVKQNLKKCNNLEDYTKMKSLLHDYGIQKFYNNMENLGVFKERKIHPINNPFAQMILGEKRNEFIDYDYYDVYPNKNFILIDHPSKSCHKFLSPKNLDWETFNVLTLTPSHLPLLKDMKKVANLYAFENSIKNFGLFFHCYPFNSVNTLHLHIVNLDVDKKFLNKTNNLKIDDVINYLSSQSQIYKNT